MHLLYVSKFSSVVIKTIVKNGVGKGIYSFLQNETH